MDWVVYDLFDTSEWPVLLISSWARKAQRLQRVQDPWSLWGMRHLVHPQMFTTERDLHTCTHKAVEDSKARAFSIQRILALLDVQRKFLSIQPCCSNPWACHSTSARFCNKKTCWSQSGSFPDDQSLLLDYWPILLRVSIQNENGSMAWPKKILLKKSQTCLHWRSHSDPEHQKRLQMSRDRLPTT